MSSFTLRPSSTTRSTLEPSGWDGLGGAILVRNARWFVQIRWTVIVALVGFGAISNLLPDALQTIGLEPATLWPWILAAILAAANVLWLARLHCCIKETTPRRAIVASIWAQVIVDLIVLTIMVHFVGSTNTFVSFAYLFHIALACIFLSTRNSFLVLLLGAILFLTCVALEATGVLAARSIMATDVVATLRPGPSLAYAVSAVFVWGVVWYLVSGIARAVRKRDQQLAAANERLIRADEEKNAQVLRTTHDLKAPFAGIEGHIQVLRFEFWEQLPEEVRKIIARIERSAETLRNRIRDILMLGELRSGRAASGAATDVDVATVLTEIIEGLSERAAQRRIRIDAQLPETRVVTNQRKLMILLENLLSNAITYSFEGGHVDVGITHTGGVHVRIADHGLGITDEALPHIFDEYYRSKEAAKFNSMSTGLGLAIVKQVAGDLGVAIDVESKQGAGTTFVVHIP